MKNNNNKLFTPLDQDDFLPGNHGAEYLTEIIWLLIEKVNELELKIKK